MLFNHRAPRHETEAEPVVKHRESATREYDGATIDTGCGAAIGNCAMLQSSRYSDCLRRVFDVYLAECCQKVAREDNALTTLLHEAAFFQELFACLERVVV